MKTHFSFCLEWYEIIKDCTTKVKGEVFSAVMEYALTGEIIEISPEATVIFRFIKREIDRRPSFRKAAQNQKTDTQKPTLAKS
ncbi:MAG: hypothetical protein K2H39_08275, partial [Paramuribaculum sp.]|nr:hypothetical protein [Paramuribaculum sp.]